MITPVGAHLVLKTKFRTEVDTSDFKCYNNSTILKAFLDNDYVLIQGVIPHPQVKITFFKSDFKGEKILDDLRQFGIEFWPKTKDDLEVIMRCMNLF